MGLCLTKLSSRDGGAFFSHTVYCTLFSNSVFCIHCVQMFQKRLQSLRHRHFTTYNEVFTKMLNKLMQNLCKWFKNSSTNNRKWIHDITDTCLDANMTTDNWSLEGQLILKFANGKRLQCQQNNCCISSETLKMVYVVVHCTKHRFHRQR